MKHWTDERIDELDAKTKAVQAAIVRVSGDGSVQIGTYFKDAKILAEEIHELRCLVWQLKDEREELRGKLDTILMVIKRG